MAELLATMMNRKKQMQRAEQFARPHANAWGSREHHLRSSPWSSGDGASNYLTSLPGVRATGVPHGRQPGRILFRRKNATRGGF